MQTQTRPRLSPSERLQLLDAGFLNLDDGYLTLTEHAWSWAESTRDVTLSSSPVAAEVLEALLRRLVPFLADRQVSLAELLPLRAAASPPARVQPSAKSTSRKATTKKTTSRKATTKKTTSRKATTKKTTSKKKTTKKTTSSKTTKKKTGASSQAVVEKLARSKQKDAPSPRVERASGTLGERIESACLALGGGKRKTRILLSLLRDQLPDVARGDLDRSLLDLQDAERLVLYREDNTAALTDEDRRAALTVNDEPRHLIMLEGRR